MTLLRAFQWKILFDHVDINVNNLQWHISQTRILIFGSKKFRFLSGFDVVSKPHHTLSQYLTRNNSRSMPHIECA